MGGMRQLLLRNKRLVTTFASRAGETISLVPNQCSYEKLKEVAASRKSGELAARNPKTPGRVSQHPDHRTAPQCLRKEFKRTFSNGTPPKKRRARVTIMVRQVRDALRRFRETARATNLKICDLFPGSRMLAHVTATPMSRSTKRNAKHVYPSPGVGRHPFPGPKASSSFRERWPPSPVFSRTLRRKPSR